MVWRAISDDYAALLGYKPNDIIGRNATQDVERSERDIERLTRQLIRDGMLVDVVTMRRRNGEHFGFAYTIRALNGGAFYVASGELVPTSLVDAAREVFGVTGEELANGGSMSDELFERAAAAGELARVGFDPWRSAAWAEEYTSLNRRTLERYHDEGLLEAGGVPGKRLYKESELDDFLRRGGLGLLSVLVLVVLGFAIACVAGVDVAQDAMQELGCPFASD